MAAVSAKPETPVFSYAQAAKGVAPAQSPPKASSPEQTKTASTPEEPDSVPKSETKPETQSSEKETNSETEKTGTNTVKGSESTAAASQQSAVPPTSKPNTSGTNSPSVDTASTAKDDDSSSVPNGTSESTWDKQSQASGTEKTKNGAEDTKEKTESATEKSAPPKELKAAPIPPVNIWQQRREAQDAKSKVIASLKPAASTTSKPSKPAPSASPVAGKPQQDQSKSPSKKKGGDTETGNASAKDRKKADAGSGRDDGYIPPAEDSTSWPTPQIAQGEEKRKAQEKTEKSEKAEKGPAVRPHGRKEWTPVPFVPNPVFSTPLPTPSRRGGRSARGGRDGGRGGTHGSSSVSGGDKASSAQTSGAKQSNIADSGKHEPNGARASTQSRRSDSADPSSQSESRKASQTTDRSRGDGRMKGIEDANAGTAGRQVNGETFPRHQKPFSKNNEPGFQKGTDHPRHFSGDSLRTGPGHDRRFENAAKSADFHRQFPQTDSHFRERGEPRSERGGRGSHRGRGGHSAFGGSHYSSFVPHKSFGFNDRHRSHHGFPNGSQRFSMKSPSMPSTPPAMYYPALPDVNTMYGYPFMPAPVSALPYQPYMEPFAIMSRISMQMEYYFSVDNLCKDIFLRKHMDSQGFVPLSFVAGFKRIKSLTEDFELLRHISRQLRNVEHQLGSDGVDRLRPREKWVQWILPLEQRDASAQNEGPPSPMSPGQSGENTAQQNHVDGDSGASASTNGPASHEQPGKSLPNGTSGSRASMQV